jgi:hypothetical protein
MATFILSDVDVFTNGYEFSSQVNTVTVTAEAAPVDVTNFGASGWASALGGIKTGMIEYGGFASHGSAEISSILGSSGVLGDGSTLVSVTPSNTENEPAFTLNSVETSVTEVGGTIGEAAPITASFANGNAQAYGLLAGRLIATNASRTATATSTGYQYGALSATQKMFSALHVVSASGTNPTLDVVIQSDDNSGFSSATSRITHTQATGITSELLSVSGAVTDDYWRASWTIGGTNTPTFRFVVILALV